MRKRRDSLARRRWKRFKRNKRGYYSLIVFLIIFSISLVAELVSNDKPYLVYYNGDFYFPICKSYPETTFGGDFETETDYRDPYILNIITTKPNRAFFPPNPYTYNSINEQLSQPV